MRRIVRKIRYFVVLLVLASVAVSATEKDKEELRAILMKFDAFYADIHEKSISKTGEEWQQEGFVALKRPNKYLYVIKSPDEMWTWTSDKALYVYDTFVNQVALYDLPNLKNSPFDLVINANDKKVWDNFEIEKKGDTFYLTNVNADTKYSDIAMSFKNNTLVKLSYKLHDMASSECTFSNQKTSVDMSLFDVKLPDDVEVSDERSH